jgi:ArsR family transcriptional regulator
MDALITMFKALSDKTRLRIMFCLLKAKKELCICEIMDALSLAQYNISRHMKELKIAGLVQEKKLGRFVFYSLKEPGDKIHEFLLEALDSFDKKMLADDSERLKKRLALRNRGKCVVGVKKSCC